MSSAFTEKESVSSSDDFQYSYADIETFRDAYEKIFEVAYDSRRSGHIRFKDVNYDCSKNTALTHIFRFFVEETPMDGIDVSVWREDSSNGMIWLCQPSDVSGPLMYPRLFSEDFDCGGFRQRLLDGEPLYSVVDDISINDSRAAKHANGRCSCTADVGPLKYSKSEGWISR